MSGPDRSAGWRLRGPELFGILLIAIGLLYLLGGLNLIRFSWDSLWPILIIGLGAIVVVNALRPDADGTGAIDIPRDGTNQLELELSVGAGTFLLGGGATNLVEVRSDHDDIAPKVDRNGSRSRIRLTQHVRPFTWHASARWEIRLAEDVPTALSAKGGAGDFRFDLTRLRIVDGLLSVGAAQALIVLPQPVGEVTIRVSAGAASVTVQVPPGVEARVTASGGLLSVSGRPETPGFAAATNRVAVIVSGGASSVRVI
jgi:hypothetical protein